MHLGLPLGRIGFAGERVSSEMHEFPLFLNDFWETVAGYRPRPRGAPGQPVGFTGFYKGFQHSGRAPHGTSSGPAICCVMLVKP